MTMKSLIVVAVIALPCVSGFLFQEPVAVKPTLHDVVNAQEDTRLKIALDIGKETDESRMAIMGIVLGIHKDQAMYEHVKLPGLNGPDPQLSSGARKLIFHKEGRFVGPNGTELVKALKGCWEIVWRKDSPAGALICGFEVPEEYKRNDASLPKGRVYLSFPVWTKDGLAYGRSEKERITKLAQNYIAERDAELLKMKETSNLLMKALHYRNAYAATENYWFQPLKSLRHVPAEHEVIKLQDDLLLAANGLVWAKKLPSGKQQLLGTATVSSKLAVDMTY